MHSAYINPTPSGKVRIAAVSTLSAASVGFPVLLIEHPAGTAADQLNPDTVPPATIQQRLSVGRTTAGEIRQDAGEQGPRPPVRTPQYLFLILGGPCSSEESLLPMAGSSFLRQGQLSGVRLLVGW